jgi:nitroreductase
MTTEDGTDLARVVRRAAVDATRAPSVHNTQPWRFTLAADGLEVHADWTRRLRVLDPRGRQMLISCGCALFNARVSIAAAGHVATVERFSDPMRATLVARLTVREPDVDLAPIGRLQPWIEGRHSNRGAFTDEVMPEADVAALVNAVSEEGAVLFPLMREDEDPAYRAELKAWTAVDPGRLDGVPGRRTVIDKDSNDVLLLLGTRHDTPFAWLSAGEALEHVLLEIARSGYSASPIVNVIEVAATNVPLRAALNLQTHPQVLLRVGRALSTGNSRRRRLADMFKESA